MEAFYLKYRPQRLDDLIGQGTVKKTLMSAYENNKISHAYILVGPRGTGKTSTARILAKMVNCESQRVKESKSQSNSDSSDSSPKGDDSLTLSNIPCNQCETCVSITDGSNLDLIEIDAASNRGIDDIRALREKIKLAPTSSSKKVYIIDEVHMLTTEAFNALLKTLEEPPSHALFIMATTDVSKVPQTILSRVQRLDFKLAKVEELLEALKKIVKNEKIDIDDEALINLAQKADGSFRDGIKLLDQISATSGKITQEVLEKSFKLAKFKAVLNLVEILSKKNIPEGLLAVSKLVEDGVDIKDLMLTLMDTLRSLVFIKNGLGEVLVKGDFMEEKYQSLIKLSENFTNKDLVKNLVIFQNALEKLKFASIPSLPLELAVVEICGEEANKKLDVRSEKMDEEVRRENQTSNIQPQNPPSNLQHLTSKQDETSTSEDILKLREKWTFVLETIRPFNFSLEALLRSVNITECTDTTIIMEVPYSFHQRILEAPKNRDILEGILSDILGRQVQISTILGARPQRIEDVANIEVAADDEIIRAAAEIFNADSVN